MKQKTYCSLLLILSILGYSQAQSIHSLQHDIDKFVSSKTFNSSNLSIAIYDIDADTVVASHRPLKVLSPASSLKVITTLTALKHLGPDFRFKTIIGYKGTLGSDGTLDGDLIIKGGGDPTFGSDKIDGTKNLKDITDYIVNQVIEAGINCVNGDILIDESIYDSYPVAPSWQWNDLGNYYASGAWGFNVHENQYYIYFNNKAAIGARPKVKYTSPTIPLLILSNEIVIDSSHTGDQAYVFGGPYNYNKRLVGTIPQGQGTFSIKGSIPDPPYFYGTYLRKAMTKANIQSKDIKQRFREDRRLSFVTIDTIFSPTLSEITKTANFQSNNLYTESILKMVGLIEQGQGSGQNGIASIIRLLRSYGVDTKALEFHDGSGLSARNYVNSLSFAKFLAGISRDLGIEECTKHMPRGGYSGTVRGLFGNSSAKGSIWLKSGSMQGVQSYTGYIKSKSGRWLSFSIIANGFTHEHGKIRREMEKFLTLVYKRT